MIEGSMVGWLNGWNIVIWDDLVASVVVYMIDWMIGLMLCCLDEFIS